MRRSRGTRLKLTDYDRNAIVGNESNGIRALVSHGDDVIVNWFD